MAAFVYSLSSGTFEENLPLPLTSKDARAFVRFFAGASECEFISRDES